MIRLCYFLMLLFLGAVWLTPVATGQPASNRQTVRGKIEEVAPQKGQFIVRLRDLKPLVLHVEGSKRFLVEGKVATLADFRAGDRVRVSYTVKDGRHYVEEMVTPPAAFAGLRKEINEALKELREINYAQKGAYAQRLAALVDEVDDRIDFLQDQLKEQNGAARKRAEMASEELRQHRDFLVARQLQMQAAGPQLWQELRLATEARLENLRESYLRISGAD